MNIRSIAGINPNYAQINREERNYAAIFFAALCKKENAIKFLRYCGFSSNIGSDFGIYFEYAFLRDLWKNIHSQEIKKQIIRQNLQINDIDAILSLPFKKINEKFGVSGNASSKSIQNPGRWALSKYNENFEDNEDFYKICKFKWAFNIKPDIVIHINKDQAICIEAKYSSNEGKYPASGIGKSIFKERLLEPVGQMEMQKYLMEELLGISTDFRFLVFKQETSKTHKVINWKDAFRELDMTKMPEFVTEMVNNVSNNS